MVKFCNSMVTKALKPFVHLLCSLISHLGPHAGHASGCPQLPARNKQYPFGPPGFSLTSPFSPTCPPGWTQHQWPPLQTFQNTPVLCLAKSPSFLSFVLANSPEARWLLLLCLLCDYIWIIITYVTRKKFIYWN